MDEETKDLAKLLYTEAQQITNEIMTAFCNNKFSNYKKTEIKRRLNFMLDRLQ